MKASEMSQKQMNDLIKKKKRWVSGAQFLSRDEKIKLIKAKTKALVSKYQNIALEKRQKSNELVAQMMKDRWAAGDYKNVAIANSKRLSKKSETGSKKTKKSVKSKKSK